ncbi:MAG: family 16 glycosylhydrolase, partial [Geminicoccaceae bacterium]|nr:family 16 glycosylhydrolase [Geminicoccaceae bacterium]
PHDEIDFEWLGRDTTEVQVNYFVDGQGRHERMIDLGFDAAEDFHVYGFEWRRDAVRWYVDCKLVHEVTSADGPMPRAPGRMYVHLWNGNDSVNDWLGEFDYDGQPVHATFDYIRHVPGGTHEEGSSCAGDRPLEAAAAEPTRAIEEPDQPAERGPVMPEQKPAMVEPPIPTEEAGGDEPVEQLDTAAVQSAETMVDETPAISEQQDPPALPEQGAPATMAPSDAAPTSEASTTLFNDGQPIPLGAFGAARP